MEKVVIEDSAVRNSPKQIIDIFHLYISILRQGIEKAPSGTTEDEVRMFILQYLKANLPSQLVGSIHSLSIKSMKCQIKTKTIKH